MCIDTNDITPDIEPQHRDAMLDLVLAWGSLDGALGVLLSCVRGLPLDQGAELIGRRPNAAKLAEVCKILHDAPGGVDAARIIEKHMDNYVQRSHPRNRIAHSHCVGVWAQDRNVIVFLTFEKVADNELAIDLIPIQEMQRSTRWAQAMRNFAIKLEGALSPET